MRHELTLLLNMVGVAGTERKKVLSQAFKIIIDTLLPSDYKLVMYYVRKGLTVDSEKIMALRHCAPMDREETIRRLNMGPIEVELAGKKT